MKESCQIYFQKYQKREHPRNRVSAIQLYVKGIRNATMYVGCFHEIDENLNILFHKKIIIKKSQLLNNYCEVEGKNSDEHC